MSKIVVPRAVAPWSISESSYCSRDEYFMSIYLLTRVDATGDCRLSFNMLANELGKSVGSGNMPKIKREIKEILYSLELRGGQEKYESDLIRVSFSHNEIDTAHKGDMFTLKVAVNPYSSLPDSFFSIEPEIIHKVSAAARAEHISPVELFCYYAYIREKMYTYKLSTGEKALGCWLSKKRLLTEYEISMPTHLKYRKALEKAGLMYMKSGKGTGTPSSFALIDNEELWDQLKKSLRKADGAAA